MSTKHLSETGQKRGNSFSKRHLIILILIFFLALFLRMYNLSERTFDHWDEGWYSASAASAIGFANYVYSNFGDIVNGDYSLSALRKTVKETSNVPFGASGKPVHSIVLLFGFMIGGFSIFSLFFEMVIIGLISMYIVYVTAVSLFDRRVGLMAAFFFAISGIMVHYSRSCMPQMVMVLFCTLAFYCSLRVSEGKWGMLFGVLSALAFFTHPATGPLLLGMWIFVGISLCYEPGPHRKRTILGILLGAICVGVLCFLMAEVPQLLKAQTGNYNYESYADNLVARGIEKGVSRGIFISFDQITYFFKNVWESESMACLFVILGMMSVFLRYRKSRQLMVIGIPCFFILAYFFTGISYRFRVFIVIYPFLHILAAVGFIYVYDLVVSKIELRVLWPAAKVVFAVLILILAINGVRTSLKSMNSNARSFQRICSQLESYLESLPMGESRAICYSPGNLSTWFSYYFSRNYLEGHYPHLAKSLIWDWKTERRGEPSVGDILIMAEAQGGIERLEPERFLGFIEKLEPIRSVRYSVIDRNSYNDSVFKRKWAKIDIYDLKNRQ